MGDLSTHWQSPTRRLPCRAEGSHGHQQSGECRFLHILHLNFMPTYFAHFLHIFCIFLHIFHKIGTCGVNTYFCIFLHVFEYIFLYIFWVAYICIYNACSCIYIVYICKLMNMHYNNAYTCMLLHIFCCIFLHIIAFFVHMFYCIFLHICACSACIFLIFAYFKHIFKCIFLAYFLNYIYTHKNTYFAYYGCLEYFAYTDASWAHSVL